MNTSGIPASIVRYPDRWMGARGYERLLGVYQSMLRFTAHASETRYRGLGDDSPPSDSGVTWAEVLFAVRAAGLRMDHKQRMVQCAV